jgi:hypothetical protein
VLGFLFRLLLVIFAVFVLLMIIRPQYVANAGTALLSPTSDSGSSGMVQVVPLDTGQSGTTFQINLPALVANFRYTITLDEGKCGGKVLKEISGVHGVQTDGNGTLNKSITIDDLNAAVTDGVYLDVHQGDSSGTTVACGQIKLNSGIATQMASDQTPTPVFNLNSLAVTPTVNTSYTGGTAVATSAANATPTAVSTTPGLPATGVNPGTSSNYDNYKYPRKY